MAELACPLCTLEDISIAGDEGCCDSCGLRENLEHFKTYEQYKSDGFYEYERTFVLVDEIPTNAKWGHRYRHKNACRCGRDLMVLVEANLWCSSGVKNTGSPCEFSELLKRNNGQN